MKALRVGVLSLGVVAALQGAAHAAPILVDLQGGALQMNPGNLPNLFDAAPRDFTNGALGTIHSQLQNDGIQTDGLVTMLVAETNHGLAFIVLVDDRLQPNDGPNVSDTQLSMTSTAPDTGVHFINDVGQGDIDELFDPQNGLITASGSFTWDSGQGGDAFAWANLDNGDFISFNFAANEGDDFNTFPGLASEETFQFVSWNGSSWEVVATDSFSVDNQFAFSFVVIPLPAPAALATAGLIGVAVLRRRKMMA